MKVGFFFFIILTASFFYLVFFSTVFKTQTITFSGEEPSCTTTGEIGKTAGVLGENIFFIDNKKVEKKIKDKFLCIRTANLQKSIPDKIKLDLKNRRAVLTLIPAVSDESTESAKPKPVGQGVLVDDEGVIFALDEAKTNQPAVFIMEQELSPGKKIDQILILGVLQAIEKIRKLGTNEQDPFIYNKQFHIGQKPKIIFNLNENLDRQLASLQLILDQAKMDEKEVEFLDLRFDKPIVKYGQRPSNLRN